MLCLAGGYNCGTIMTDQEVEQKIRSAVRALDGNYYAVVNVERSYT